MAKVKFSDVTPPEKRSIRNIPIPQGGKRKPTVVIQPEVKKVDVPIHPEINEDEMHKEVTSRLSELTEVKQEGPYEYYYPKTPKAAEQHVGPIKKPKMKHFFFLTVAIIAVGIFVVSMMTVFASASIVIKPKTQSVDVSMNVLATPEAGEQNVRYEVVKLSKSQTASVPATGEEAVDLKAKGKIVIYNNFSTEPQRLIVRTRFETPEGLIYRIPESVTVPGKSVKNGVETPGSIEVEVFADESGEKFNIKKTDFTVPGFKNDPERYKGFYARSSTNMEGGFVGKMKTVKPSDKEAAIQNIESEVKSLLQKELESKITDGLTLLNGAIIYEFSDIPQKDSSGGVEIGREGTAYAILINRGDLSNIVSSKYISTYPGWENIQAGIIDFSGLSVTNTPKIISAGEKLDLNIEGKAQIAAQIDRDLVSQKLAGVSRKDINTVLDQFAGISSVTTTVRPMWKQSFPDNSAKIEVEIVPNP